MKKLLLASLGFLMFTNINGMDGKDFVIFNEDTSNTSTKSISNLPAAKEPPIDGRVSEDGKHSFVYSYTVLEATKQRIPMSCILMLPLIEGIPEMGEVPTAKANYSVRVPVYKYEWNPAGKALGKKEKGGAIYQNQTRLVNLLAGERITTGIYYGKGWKAPVFSLANNLAELGIQ